MSDDTKDNINSPSHYTAGSIEVYDFIDAWGLDFAIGNVVKYVVRAPYKRDKLEDLKKAAWYLGKAIEKEERAIADRVAGKLDKKNEIASFVSYDPTLLASNMFDQKFRMK